MFNKLGHINKIKLARIKRQLFGSAFKHPNIKPSFKGLLFCYLNILFAPLNSNNITTAA